jgi:sporulation protein YlmC with PRC-barrel domain
MEIPLKAQVECTDGVCGRSVYVVINPVTEQVTHLVVKGDASPHTEQIVPVDFVTDTTGNTIKLRCSTAELEKMDPFIQTTFIAERVPESNYSRGGGEYGGNGSYYYEPYVTLEKTIYVPEENQQLPPGELAVRRGTRVEATDGFVGKVDEFVVNPENGYITHMVMREGHLWGKKEVAIPLSAMGEYRDDTVFLKLDKQEVESLPTFPVHRNWA